MRLVVPLFFTVVMLISGSCTTDHGEQNFRDSMNLELGHPITDLEKFPHVEVPLDNGKTEYQFSNKNGGRWAFVVKKDGTIESWRYLSDPALCTVGYNWLGPW